MKKKVKEEKKKAVIYARQSSGSEDVSESVEAQIMNCRLLSKKENMEIVGIFKDLNTSGETYPIGAEAVASVDQAYLNWVRSQKEKKELRSGLGALIERLKKNDISFLIVNEMTRLYRPVSNSFLETYINNLLRDHKITVYQVQGGKIDLSQFDQHLITMIKNQVLFEDLEKKRINSKIGKDHRRDSGKLPSGCQILGIDYLGNDKLRMNPDYVPLIKFIYDGVLNYRTYNSIIRDCNEKFAHLHHMLYPSNLYHIVRQPMYAGYQYDTSGKLIKNNQITGQEIIPLPQWRAAQAILDYKRQRPKGTSSTRWLPLSSRLFCSFCGGHLSCNTDKNITSYLCRKSYYSGEHSDCSGSRIRYSTLENGEYYGLHDSLYPLLLIGMIVSYENAKKLRKIALNREKYQKKIEELENREKFIAKMCEDTSVAEKKILASMKKLRAERLKLSIALAETEVEMPNKKFSRFASYWHYVKRIRLRDLKQSIFEDFVHLAELTATIYPNRVAYHTIAGEFSVPRIIEPKRKSMPEWDIDVKRPMSESRVIRIVYHAYTGKYVRVLKWKNLEIYVS